MKKSNYQNCLKELLVEFDKYYKVYKDEQKVADEFVNRTKDKQQQTGILFFSLVWQAEKDKELEHLFIKDDSLFEFLSQTKVNTESLKAIAKDVEFPFFYVHSKTDSFAFYIAYKDAEFIVSTVRTTGRDLRFVITLDDSINEKECVYPRMAANLLLYMNAFPDKVSIGVPDDYKVSSVGSIKNKVIGKSEKISVSHGTGKATHFRSGYFRYYPKDSTWYKNVAGTSQWIDATVVNGKAKTIKGE